MNRRELIMVSGAAIAAKEGLAQAQKLRSTTPTVRLATAVKTLLKYNHAKASYGLPKSETKAATYVDSLSAAFTLSPDQQQAASAIFVNAVNGKATIKGQIKAARQNISRAVIANDGGRILQESASIGNLKARLIASGASAHSAFFQLLTPAQQQLLLQYRS